ncbi:MAG: DUF4149 domain-containing protein [Nitrospiria bacterium]
MSQVIVMWVHLIAAMFWIGGMLFFAIVLVPCLRSGLPENQRTELISRVGLRFRGCAWILIGMLLVTGLFRLYQNGIPLSQYGRPLSIKLSLVFILMTLSVLHDFVLGPKSIALSRTLSRPHPLQKTVRWIARINLLVGLMIVLAAVSLVHRL